MSRTSARGVRCSDGSARIPSLPSVPYRSRAPRDALLPRARRLAHPASPLTWSALVSSTSAALVASVLSVLPVLSVLSVLSLIDAPHCHAYENVRVEDVESDVLRAGLEAANDRNWVAAERFFQTYLKQEENSASGYSNLGNVHLQMGKIDLAVKEYDKAVELSDAKAAVPLLNRGLAYEELGVREDKAGRHDAAVRYWNTGKESLLLATERDPEEFAAFYDLGLIEMRLGQYEESSEHLQKAADLAAIPGYRVRSAVSLYQIGNVKGALVQLRGVVRKTPNYAEAHAALAAAYYGTGSLELAEDELRRATELDPLWGVPEEVEKNARWPPALYEAHRKMISIS